MNPIMADASTAVGTRLRQIDGATVTRPYEWKPMLDIMGRWSGEIIFECSTHAEQVTLIRRVHTCSIEVNGTCCVLEVFHAFRDVSADAAFNNIPARPASTDAGTTNHPLGGRLGEG